MRTLFGGNKFYQGLLCIESVSVDIINKESLVVFLSGGEGASGLSAGKGEVVVLPPPPRSLAAGPPGAPDYLNQWAHKPAPLCAAPVMGWRR